MQHSCTFEWLLPAEVNTNVLDWNIEELKRAWFDFSDGSWSPLLIRFQSNSDYNSFEQNCVFCSCASATLQEATVYIPLL
jgi:hypothetical protein